MPTQHKDRVYHWKHGWIPLDHQAAVQKYGSASLAQKHGFGHVSAKDLPRKEHITAHFDSNTGHFTLRDTRSGNTAKMTTRQADAHQRSGQQVTTIGQGGRISKTRAPAPAPAPTPAPPTPAPDPSPVKKSSRGVAMKRSPAEQAAAERASKQKDFVLASTIKMLEKRVDNPSYSVASRKKDRVILNAYRAEYERRTKGTGPATEPSWMKTANKAPGEHEDAFKKANPKFRRSQVETTINCAKVVQAYELRRRGIDVEAQVGPAQMSTPRLANLWVNKDTGDRVQVQHAQSRESLEKFIIKEAPPGARFHVSVTWRGRPPGSPPTSAHIFNAERTSTGGVKYYDAQVRDRNVGSYFNRADTDSYTIQVYRVDDAVPSNDPIWTEKILQKN